MVIAMPRRGWLARDPPEAPSHFVLSPDLQGQLVHTVVNDQRVPVTCYMYSALFMALLPYLLNTAKKACAFENSKYVAE